MLAVLVLAATACLEKDARHLSSDGFGGRDNGSPGSLLAQEHLIERMEGWSVGANSSATGVQAYHQDFAQGRNIIAVIPGTDLAHEYVMVGAHYDGLGSGLACRGKTAEDSICNGATDNATGTALVLNLAERLGTWTVNPPRRSIIVAFWDAEEDGLLGSKAYVANPLIPLEDTVAYVNVDLVGSNLRTSIASTTFAIGAETGGSFLVEALADAAAPGELDTRTLSLAFGLGRSDHAVLAGAAVPVVYFTDSTGPCYHSVEDDIDVVDWVKAEEQLDTAHRLVVDLATSDDTPTHDPDAPAIAYEDAVSLAAVLADLRTGTAEFTPEGYAALEAHGETLDQIVADGPEGFGLVAQSRLINGAMDAIDLLTTGPCDAFLPER